MEHTIGLPHTVLADAGFASGAAVAMRTVWAGHSDGHAKAVNGDTGAPFPSRPTVRKQLADQIRPERTFKSKGRFAGQGEIRSDAGPRQAAAEARLEAAAQHGGTETGR
jgi:hypothetical protein